MWFLWMLLGIFLALLAFIVFLFAATLYKLKHWQHLDIPHEEPKKLLEIYREMRAKDEPSEKEIRSGTDCEHLKQLYQRFKGTGPFCGFYRLLRPTVLVLDRELVKQILFKDFSNFNDRGNYYNVKSDPLSASLYNMRGQHWRETRPKMEHLFGDDKLKFVYDCLERESQQFLLTFEQKLPIDGATIKVRDTISRYICEAIATCVIGMERKAGGGVPKLYDEFFTMTQMALTTRRHGSYIQGLLYKYPTMAQHMHFAITTSKVHDYFMSLIQEVVSNRELYKTEVKDFMQLLIERKAQQYRNNEPGADEKRVGADVELRQRLLEELAASAFGFLNTGYESTARTLIYALHELALQKELQQRLREEIQEALKRHDNKLSYACVNELELLEQVLQETIRLHPIVPYLTRKTLHDYRILNNEKYLLSKNMYIIIPIHAMHNDPEYFPEPHLFKPERFTAEAKKSRDPCSWLGFGTGPRDCLAMRFALLQMRITLAHLLSHFNFSVNLGNPMPTWENGVELLVEHIHKKKGNLI